MEPVKPQGSLETVTERLSLKLLHDLPCPEDTPRVPWKIEQSRQWRKDGKQTPPEAPQHTLPLCMALVLFSWQPPQDLARGSFPRVKVHQASLGKLTPPSASLLLL